MVKAAREICGKVIDRISGYIILGFRMVESKFHGYQQLCSIASLKTRLLTTANSVIKTEVSTRALSFVVIRILGIS